MGPILKILIVLGLTAGFGWLISENSRDIYGIPIILFIFALNNIIQILAFVPSKIMNTERFYDLTGSITYITATLLGIYTKQKSEIREKIAVLMVVIWATRLGSFLFYRILLVGEDTRFIVFKKKTLLFLYVWLVQGLWVTITASPVFVFLSKTQNKQQSLNILEITGIVLWIVGLIIEVIADMQKFAFKRNKDNHNKFIKSGIWKYSRHPNYCGQIILWTGVSVFIVSSLQGLELLTMISPIFVYILLTKLSGVPLLERKSDKKWGNDPEYIAYKQRTPAMFLKTSTKSTNHQKNK